MRGEIENEGKNPLKSQKLRPLPKKNTFKNTDLIVKCRLKYI